jgi:hypothetical protein
MPPIRYVGRTPDSDTSVVPRSYVNTRYDTIRVDDDYINSEVAAQASAAGLVNPAYVDQQDNLRALKTAVDAADQNYVPTTQVGQANGVVPLDNNSYVTSPYLPTVQTNRKPLFVPATSIIISGQYQATSNNPKEYQAASLTIPDPGYPYVPLIFAQVLGGSTLGASANRMMGTGSYGQISVLRNDDTKYSWCLTTAHRHMAMHTALPFADNSVNPGNRLPIEGAVDFSLWLSLWSGSTYTFASAGLTFFALVYPGL